MHPFSSVRSLSAGLLLGLAATCATAQSFPSRMVTLTVPYPAGGGADHVARTIQGDLAKLLGQTLIVDNVGGVGGALGIQKVLQAPADGHTVLVASPMDLILTPLSIQAAKHKPEDMRLVAVMVSTSMVMVARKDLSAGTVDELIAMAKKPGFKELSYGSVGAGSLYHLVAESFAQQTGVQMLHVPYKGMAPLLADLMGGQIDIAFVPMAGGVPALIKDGKIKAYGLAANKPHPLFPSLPLLTSSKVLTKFEFGLWAGMAVPKKTPDAAAERLNQAIYQALQNPEIRKSYEVTGNVIEAPRSISELDRHYATEIARYQGIAKAVNVQPQ